MTNFLFRFNLPSIDTKRINGYVFMISIFLFCMCSNNSISPNENQNLPYSQYMQTVGIIVNKNLYPSISSSLNQYVRNLKNIENKNVWLCTEFDATSSKEDLRDTLKTHFIYDMLEGAVFIGDLPVAYYEFESEGVSFPCDLYFMDLDGNWLDTVNEDDPFYSLTPGKAGVFDVHCGNVEAEIWVSRIAPSTIGDSEVNMINEYFDKVRKRMDGERYFKKGVIFANPQFWCPDKFELLYPDSNFDIFTSMFGYQKDSKENYLKVLQNNYEYGLLKEHGSAFKHLIIGESFTIDDIDSLSMINGNSWGILFLNLFSCNNADFTQNNIASNYIFKSRSLVTIGSTKEGGMLDIPIFHSYLNQGLSFGNAFKQWTNRVVLKPSIHFLESEFSFGMVLLGTGTLGYYSYGNSSTNSVKVIINSDTGGTTNKSGVINIRSGDSIYFEVLPYQDYELDTILIDNNNVTKTSFPLPPPGDLNIYNQKTVPIKYGCKVSSIYEHTIIGVKFKKRPKFTGNIFVTGCASIDISNPQGVNIDPKGISTTFYMGDNLFIRTTPKSINCKIDSIIINGKLTNLPEMNQYFDTLLEVNDNFSFNIFYSE